MAAPSPVEIANLKTWSLHRHYFRSRALYIGHGKAVVAGNRAMLQRVKGLAPAQLVTITVTEDDIAAGLLAVLSNDTRSMAYLGRKAHMISTVNVTVTDTMARFIAWDGYPDLIK